MRSVSQSVGLSLLLLLALAATACAEQLVVPEGTPVVLVFDQAVSSKTAKVGDVIPMHVKDQVSVGKEVVIRQGTAAQAVISKVQKRKRYGINAEIRLVIEPVKSVTGKLIPLEPQGKGQQVGGKKTGQAAAATAGGAIVLGPVGLIGGYFVHGKAVNIKKGDAITTEVVQDVVLRRK